MLEERKRIRATAKETQLRTQAQKAAKREAAKLRQQLTQYQKKGSKGKGKQKDVTPEISSDEVDEVDEELFVELVAPTPARSRRNRQINLPRRFCT